MNILFIHTAKDSQEERLSRYEEMICLLAGGSQVTLAKEHCIQDSFDALCIGWIKQGGGVAAPLPQNMAAPLQSMRSW